MNDYQGTLVCVEGIDGAGTTTLVEKLENEYPDATCTKEPSDGFYGKAIRDRLEKENNATPADFYAFLADRYEHCDNVIEPSLESGQMVISDRYALSTYAYQSKILDEELGLINPIDYIDDMTYHFTIEPDLYIYLSIDVDTALERIDTDDKYEKRENLKEAKRMYDYLTQQKDNIVSIPGQWDEQGIFEEAKMWIGDIDDRA
jgi:dTMP kinase